MASLSKSLSNFIASNSKLFFLDCCTLLCLQIVHFHLDFYYTFPCTNFVFGLLSLAKTL